MLILQILGVLNSYSGKPEVNWCHIGLTFVRMVKINFFTKRNKENASAVTSFLVSFFTLGSPFLLLWLFEISRGITARTCLGAPSWDVPRVLFFASCLVVLFPGRRPDVLVWKWNSVPFGFVYSLLQGASLPVPIWGGHVRQKVGRGSFEWNRVYPLDNH